MNQTLDDIGVADPVSQEQVLLDARIAFLNEQPAGQDFDPWSPVSYVLHRFSTYREAKFSTFREAVVAALFDLEDNAATPLEIKVLGESVWRKTGQCSQDIIGELESLRGKK